MPVSDMIRFVVGPDAQIVPDILGKLPGRGIWVSADKEPLKRRRRKNLFARSAKQPVTVPDGLGRRSGSASDTSLASS